MEGILAKGGGGGGGDVPALKSVKPGLLTSLK